MVWIDIFHVQETKGLWNSREICCRVINSKWFFVGNTNYRVCTLLSFSNSMTFHDLFHAFFPVFQGLKLSCHFRKLSKSSLFSGIYWHNLPVFYFDLAATPALIYVPHILYFSMTFHDPQLNSLTFQTWKLKYLNSMTLQVFHDP